MLNEIKITFQPSGRTVFALPGTGLLEAAARAGLILQSPCGGKGSCGKCAVHVTVGDCPPTPACEKFFTAARLKKGLRLACQAKVFSNCIVEVPATSLFEKNSKILTAAHGRKLAVKPGVWKKYVALTPPTQGDDAADFRRLEKALDAPVKIGLELLRRLPGLMRAQNFQGTAVVSEHELLDFEAGDTTACCCGVAFDLGTTTVVGELIDMTTGQEAAVAATLNPQVALGDDVITRINQVRENPAALEELRESIIQTFNALLAELARQVGRTPAQIYEITVAGNTTMQHLFCGVSPAALGELPFAAAFSRALLLHAAEAGLKAHPRARLYVFPNIGGFVGGDTVAGILAASLHESKAPTLLVDIGTNGEIVLAHNGRLTACSTAAGPAFEGARISAGMRATDGAIEKVIRKNGDFEYNVIGNTAPAGICGTALLDIVAELLRVGVLDPSGRLLPPDELPATVPPAFRDRVRLLETHADFLLVDAAASRTGEPIFLRQRDIRELQLAAAAIRSGITILLKHAGLTLDQLDAVLLAGGFGNFIRRNNARRIGLLPPQIPSEKIRFVGNTSLLGAKAVLLSTDERKKAEQLAAQTVHVDLSLDPEFQMEFSSAILFPDETECP